MTMTKTFGKLALGLMVLAVLSGGAQQKPTSSDVPKYDVASQQTVSGTIQEVKDYQCPVSGSLGTHLAIKTGSEVLEAHLAPAAFLKEYGMSFKPGDSVKVVGVRAMFDGKPAILVREITMGDVTATFRDDKGRPAW
jgi:DNA/RNA endonuclease YhcR with UshA esterase domain